MHLPTKSTSLDPIPTFLLKTCVDSLVPIITRFVNILLLGWSVPDQLKTCVAPIFKKPKLDHWPWRIQKLLPDFKSSSFQNSWSIVLHLKFFLTLWKTISNAKAQSAYRSGVKVLKQHCFPLLTTYYLPLTNHSNHSTTTIYLEVQDYVLNNMDKGSATGTIFLDLKKAFDTVNHEILMNKLASYGIKDNELDRFKLD